MQRLAQFLGAAVQAGLGVLAGVQQHGGVLQSGVGGGQGVHHVAVAGQGIAVGGGRGQLGLQGGLLVALGLQLLVGGTAVDVVGDFIVQLLNLQRKRRDLNVQRGIGLLDGGIAGQRRGSGLDGGIGAVDGGDHGSHLVKVALGFFQIGGQGGGVVLAVVLGQNLLAAGKQRVVDGQGDLRQAGRIGLQAAQLLVGLVQLAFQVGDLLLQRGNLVVQLGNGVPQLLGDVGFLGVQLAFAAVQLRLGVVQLGQTFVDLGAVLVQLVLGFGQPVTDFHQQLVVHLIDLVLIEGDLHGLLHQAGGGNAGYAVHALQLGQDRVVDVVGQLVDVHALAVHSHVLGGHHIGADLDQRGSAGHVGQGVAQLVHGRAGLDHGAVHVGIFLVFQKDKAVVLVALAGHVFHAVQRGKAVFQRLGHVGLHLFRAGAGVGGHYQQVGQVHRGQQIRLDAQQADHAQHQHQYDRHQNGEGLFDTVFRHRLKRSFLGLTKTDRPVGRQRCQYSTNVSRVQRRRKKFTFWVALAGRWRASALTIQQQLLP